jgi:hypothetical protein
MTHEEQVSRQGALSAFNVRTQGFADETLSENQRLRQFG